MENSVSFQEMLTLRLTINYGKQIMESSQNEYIMIVKVSHVRQDFRMTTVMNEKLARSYIKSLEDKLLKKIKPLNKKVTTEDIVEFIFQILPFKHTNDVHLEDAKRIIESNHQTIIDNRCQIQYLRRKADLENELTASFIKTILKEKNKAHFENLSRTGLKSSFLNVPNISSLSRYEISGIQPSQSRIDQILFDRSPFASNSKKDDQQSVRYGVCNTSRSKISCPKRQSSEFSEQMQPQEKQKLKALKKLRKLEKYIFEKQNIHRDKSGTKIWNGGISPSKLRYKQENENLKVIQSNLVTHLTLLEKFRQVPSVEGLVARQQALKKKERHLKQLSEILQKKQVSLNKKHCQFLKRQKSQKVL